jgi:hypothetical protein
MLEIIALVAAVVVIVWTPIEAAKVRGGWVRRSFKGTAEDFRARYAKQLAVMGWVGVVLGAFYIGLAILDGRQGPALYVKLGIGAAWIAAGAVSFWCRARMTAAVPPTPGPTAR